MTKLLTISLITTVVSLSVSQAATFNFSSIRASQTGSVDSGSFTFDSTSTAAPSVTAVYTLTADFDLDGLNDTLEFSLIGTGLTNNAGVNGNGNIGIGGPRIDVGETIEFTVSIGALTLSSGQAFTATFDGFTGGNFNGSAFPDNPTDPVFNANGEGFLTQPFSVDAADALVIDILTDSTPGDATDDPASGFLNGVDFAITVDAV